MSLTVCKFGGSSVSDASMFVHVNRIIRADSSRRYIVLSAPGKRCTEDEKITDLFYRAHESSQFGDISILASIFKRYASIRDSLAPDFDLEGEFAQLRSLLPTSLDYAASRGEYLCAKLFSAYTHLPFIDSANLFFFGEDGQIDMEATSRAVRSFLSCYHMAVIPGFYGTDSRGKIKTFTRGGSDVSGALLASILEADLYENWTDVDGLYTADPNIIPDARRNRHVSLKQMESIASAGAKLLHPDALSCLQGTGIDTVLKNTFSPGDPGTRISESYHNEVCCVTGQRGLYMLGDPDDRNSCVPFLHMYPVRDAVKVAAIRVFGLNNSAIDWLNAALSPIHIIHMHNHIQIIIPEKEYESAIRTVHAMLPK